MDVRDGSCRRLIDLKRFEEAERLSDQAAAATIAEDVQASAAWRCVKARTLAHRKRIEDAERLAREAVRMTAPTDELNERAHAWTALAVVLSQGGRCDEASQAFDTALAFYQRKENTSGATMVAALRRSAVETPPPLPRRTSREPRG
jgi:Flp pilus assembly protein TadD